mmetsp:Transcript_48417/g.105579  ORF Transcript_48417/g.105579 Transcript_48417/m.105579 type:complete len:207 (+) Transcript_48417:351-971(+)
MLKLLITILDHLTVRPGRSESRLSLGFLQLVAQGLVLPPQASALLSDAAQVGFNLVQPHLRLGLFPQVLISLQHRAPQLIHQISHLVDLIPHLSITARLEAALQQSHLLKVCLSHLSHHLHGLLALSRELTRFSPSLQKVLLQGLGLIAPLFELLLQALGLRSESFLFRRGDGQLLLIHPQFLHQIGIVLQHLLVLVVLNTHLSLL